MRVVRYFVWWLVWMLVGALVYLALYGEPDFAHVGVWGVMVFWPLVLAYHALFWVILIGCVAFASIYIYRQLA